MDIVLNKKRREEHPNLISKVALAPQGLRGGEDFLPRGRTTSSAMGRASCTT